MTKINKIGDCSFARGGASTTIKNGVLTALASNEPAFEVGGVRAWGQVTNSLPHSNPAATGAGTWTKGAAATWQTVNDPVYGEFLRGIGVNTVMLSSSGAALYYGALSTTTAAEFKVLLRVNSLSGGSQIQLRISSPNQVLSITPPVIGEWFVASIVSSAALASANVAIGTANSSILAGIDVKIASVSTSIRAPFIPTSGTAVTSPKEICTIPTPTALSGSAWSIAATVTPRAIASGFNGSIIASNPINGFDIYIDSAGALFCEAGGVTSSVAAGITNNVAKRFVITKSGNNYTINVAGVSGSFVGGALSVDSLTYIGSDANGSWQANSNISNLKIYPRALSATEIQAELNA